MLKHVKEKYLDRTFKDAITSAEDGLHLKKVILFGIQLSCLLAMFFVGWDARIIWALCIVSTMCTLIVEMLVLTMQLVVLDLKGMLYKYTTLVWDLVWSVEAPDGKVKEEDQTNIFKLYCDAQEIQNFLYHKYQSLLRKPDEELAVLHGKHCFFVLAEEAKKLGTAHTIRKPLDYLTYLDTFPDKLPG